MADWREIMEQADQAKCQMIVDQARGEQMFSDLILRVGNDGMVYFKRAEAYEALQMNNKALEDYKKALALFPQDKWKRNAGDGIRRVS
jgi:tetratricopeptide (TPR) repeat protein